MEFMWTNFEDNILNLTVDKLKNHFENIDQHFFKTVDRNKFKLIKTRIRKIKTPWGVIIFNRRIWKDLITKENICFTDRAIGINYRAKISNFLKLKILNFLGDGKRYRDIVDTMPNCNISHSTISRIFKNAKISLKDSVNKKIPLNHKERIYINTDDAYTNVLVNNKKTKCRVRIVSFNTGIDKGSKYRNMLANKTAAVIITTENETIEPDDYAHFVWNKINKFYAFNEWTQLTVGGDGAFWIRNLAKWFGANYVLDKYHAFAYFKKIWIPGKKINSDKLSYHQATKLFSNGNHQLLMEMLEKKEKAIYTYFKGNKEGIINQAEDWNIGVSAESDVSHLIKSIKGYGAKIYTLQTFTNMVYSRINKLNLQNFR